MILYHYYVNLNRIHVVFGQVIQGFEIVDLVENSQVDEKDRPIQKVTISHCGELIKKIKEKKRSKSSSSSSSAESTDSNKSASRSKKKKKNKKSKRLSG